MYIQNVFQNDFKRKQEASNDCLYFPSSKRILIGVIWHICKENGKEWLNIKIGVLSKMI